MNSFIPINVANSKQALVHKQNQMDRLETFGIILLLRLDLEALLVRI